VLRLFRTQSRSAQRTGAPVGKGRLREIDVMKAVATLFVIGCVISGGVAEAATYYTAKTGSDIYTCAQAQSLSTPMLSILNGTTCLSAGDTLLVRAGTYDEVFMNPSITSGTPGAYTRIAAYPGTSSPPERDPSLAGKPAGWDTVFVTPSPSTGANAYVFYFQSNQQYIEFDGINMNALDSGYGPFKIDSAGPGYNPHHIRYKNAEVQYGTNNPVGASNAFLYADGSPSLPGFIGGNETINLHIHADLGGVQNGTVIGYTHYINSSNNLVAGCNLHNSGSSAIQVNNDHGGRPDSNIIRNNWIHDVVFTYPSFDQYWGIITDVDTNTQIYNNVIWKIGVAAGPNTGILVYGSQGVLIYNNTLYGIGGANDTGIGIGPNTSNNRVENNISFNHSADYADFGSGTVADHNLFNTNPNFMNAAGGDFRLGAGSPASNTGSTLSLVARDILGLLRPQGTAYDIGAYEISATWVANLKIR
jgi:hypothetical protein